jgi:predicted helicase
LADKDTLILDPATGTATFLRRVIDQIHTHVTAHGNAGVWPQYVRERLLPRIFGFEYMMAPYTVAHLKLALQLQEQGFEFEDGERLHVYLTNTLDQLHQKNKALLGDWIAKENEGAEKVKRDKPVQVVLGNPPYYAKSRNKSVWITELIKLYKTEPEGGPLKEHKHWLNDDYVKFIRFAHDRVMRTGYGIVAFITNHSWLDNPTFRGMRASLMRDFDTIYVIDLHGSAKNSESTPKKLLDQGDDKNVFDIQQGVSIVFLLKRKIGNLESPADEPEFSLTSPSMSDFQGRTAMRLAGGLAPLKAKIQHCDLWGSREHKYAWLEAQDFKEIVWRDLQPPLPYLQFTKRDDFAIDEYLGGWKSTDIFPLHSTGIVTARDGFVVDFEDETIRHRIDFFLDPKNSDEDVRRNLKLNENYIWRIADARKQLAQNKDWQSFLAPLT